MKTKLGSVCIATMAIVASVFCADSSAAEALKVSLLSSDSKTNSRSVASIAARTTVENRMPVNKPSTLDVVPCKVKTSEPASMISNRWENPQHFKDYPALYSHIAAIVDHKPSGWDCTDFYTIFSTDGQSACDIFRWNPWKVGLGRYYLFPGVEIDANYGIDNSGHGWEDYRLLAIISAGRK
jgi:hypothetical protein